MSKIIYISLKDLQELEALPSIDLLNISHQLGQRGKKKLGGIEYQESRPYVAGDDIRAIDWRSSSKGRGLYTKIYKEDQQISNICILEQSSRMFFGSGKEYKSVLAARLATRFAYDKVARKQKITSFIFDDNSFEIAEVEKNNLATLLAKIVHFNNALNVKSASQPASKDMLATSLRFIFERKIKGNIFLFVDFDSLNESVLDIIRVLVLSGVKLQILCLIDHMEEYIDLGGDLRISDGTNEYYLDSDDEKFREMWQERFYYLKERLAKFASTYNVGLDFYLV